MKTENTKWENENRKEKKHTKTGKPNWTHYVK